MRRRRLGSLALLALVWVLLWGSWNAGDVVNGVLVALLVTTLLPLPRVATSGRLHPAALLHFLAVLVADLVRSSLQVAWQALRPGPLPSSSVVAVQLRSRSELVMTITTEALSLVPGSIVVELDTRAAVLYAHVLSAGDRGSVEAFRANVLALEDRVRRSLGETDVIARASA